MKNIVLIIFASFIFSGMTAQDEETIAISEDACGCMEQVDLTSPKSEQYEKIKAGGEPFQFNCETGDCSYG